MVNQSFFRKICLIFKINCVNIKTITKLSNLGYHTLISEQYYESKKKIQIVLIFVPAASIFSSRWKNGKKRCSLISGGSCCCHLSTENNLEFDSRTFRRQLQILKCWSSEERSKLQRARGGGGGRGSRISGARDDQTIFFGFKFSLSGFVWVGKF